MDFAVAQSLEGLLSTARRERARGNRMAALEALEAAAALDPQNHEIMLERARELSPLGRLNEAEALLACLLAAEARNVPALIERGHLRRRRGDRPGAAADYAAASVINPQHAGIKLELIQELLALGRLDEADAMLAGLLATEPRLVGGLVWRGHLRRRRGDHAGAAEDFATASAIDPEHLGIKIELARDLKASGRAGEAAAVLEPLLGAHPDHVGATMCLGQLKLDTGRLAEAEALFRRARALDPKNAGAHSALGHLHRRSDRSQALDCFRAAAGADPGNPHLKLELAAELGHRGDLDKALQLVEEALAAQPSHRGARMQAGHLYRLKGDRLKAVAAFEAAAEAEPQFTQALVELANESRALGRRDEASAMLQRALAQEPAHCAALLVSAEHALADDDATSALALARRAIAAHPAQVGPYLVAARAATALIDRPAALDLLQQARDRCGALPEIAATRVHILRQFRDHPAVRAAIDAAEAEGGASHFGFWMERTSFAISQGDFALAAGNLDNAQFAAPRERARMHFLQAHVCEAERRYADAIRSYLDALALAPDEGSWHDELARALLLVGDPACARKHLQRSFELNAAARQAKGQSLNISQHHTGQLLDEFTLDAAVARALAEIGPLPSAQRIEPLKQLVRENSDNTAPAIMLLIALRQAGHLAASAPDQGETSGAGIPRRITQYWHAASPPADVRELMRTWKDAHPDYEHRVFDDRTARHYLRSRYPAAVLQAFRRASHPAQRADLFRLAALAAEGGFYVDADDLCLARLDTFVPPAAALVGYQENYGTIANNFIGSAPRHSVIVRALVLAVEALNRGDHDLVWLATGPGLMTRAFCELACQPGGERLLNASAILELHAIERFLGIHAPARYKGTADHWSSAAFRKNPKSSAPDKEALQRASS